MLKLLLPSLLLMACSTSGITRHGVYWTAPYTSNITSEKIEVVMETTLEVFNVITNSKLPYKALGKIKYINFTYPATFCFVGRCYVQVKNGVMWVQIRNGCLAWTSLVHGYVHVFSTLADTSDPYHVNPKLFEKAVGPDTRSVEYLAKIKSSRICD